MGCEVGQCVVLEGSMYAMGFSGGSWRSRKGEALRLFISYFEFGR